MKYIYLFAIALFLLSSCSEDPVSTTNNDSNTTVTRPTLELKPDTLYGKTLTACCLEARVNGFIHNDIELYWYFGEGDTVHQDWYNHGYSCHVYDKPGTYTIFVKAVDAFADTVIDTKTTIAIITDVEKKVTVLPATGDVVVDPDIIGKNFFLSFHYTSTLPESMARAVWHVTGDGLDTTINNTSSFGFYVGKFGSYHATVDIYDTNGVFWASNSTTINCIPREISPEIISQMNMISVFFHSPTPIIANPSAQQSTYITGVQRLDFETKKFILSSSSFDCSSSIVSQNLPKDAFSGTDITGTFSADLKSVQELSLTVYDTSTAHTAYDFLDKLTFRNIRIISVSTSAVVYGVYNTPLTEFANATSYGKGGKEIYDFVHAYDNYYPLITQFANTDEPYAFIVFSRSKW